MLTILVLWTWGLTPVWVNVLGTVFVGLKMLFNIGKAILKLPDDEEDDLYSDL